MRTSVRFPARVSLEQILDGLARDPEFNQMVTRWERIPPRRASYAEYPAWLDGRISASLRRRGILSLYSHQADALETAHAGKHTVVVTPTASGKTLCYDLPVIDAIAKDPTARALYIFPTKALAQDQLAELMRLAKDVDIDLKTYTYDGDTPPAVRAAIRSAGHVVVTNPDMLHTGILPHHTKWVKLFENLRYVVIDELHQYRGVFGSHVANVIRRLHRVCRFYGSDPIFICCSATIANPRELAENLVRRPVTLIDDNGAPSGRKVVAIYNPPVVNRELGIREGAVESARKIGSRLLQAGVQTIVFAPSRVRVELLLRYLRDGLKQRIGEPPQVEGYRGGYLPNERRAVERGLREGRIRGVVATNALELGNDIGGLDATVLTGYPGTLASAWQQIGRAGRRNDLSFSALVASSSPLNQYVATHPDYLFDTSPESGLVDPDNLLVRISHIKCAAFEVPFEEAEPADGPCGYGDDAPQLLEMLATDGVLVKAAGRYHWMAEAFPAENVSLRSAAIDTFVVTEQGPKPKVIAEVDRTAAPLLIHEEAIYMHGGVQYHVDRLDWHEKKAYVRKVDVDYYTDANLAVDLEVLEPFESAPAKGCVVDHGV